MSTDGSLPRTSASIGRPVSPKRILTFLSFPTTCELETIVPSLSTTKPVPVPSLDWMETTPLLAAA